MGWGGFVETIPFTIDDFGFTFELINQKIPTRGC